MRCIKTVLTPGAWGNAIVGTVILSMLITELAQLLFAILPIDRVTFAFRKVTGIANTMLIEIDRGLFCVFGVLSFVRAP